METNIFSQSSLKFEKQKIFPVEEAESLSSGLLRIGIVSDMLESTLYNIK